MFFFYNYENILELTAPLLLDPIYLGVWQKLQEVLWYSSWTRVGLRDFMRKRKQDCYSTSHQQCDWL